MKMIPTKDDPIGQRAQGIIGHVAESSGGVMDKFIRGTAAILLKCSIMVAKLRNEMIEREIL